MTNIRYGWSAKSPHHHLVLSPRQLSPPPCLQSHSGTEVVKKGGGVSCFLLKVKRKQFFMPPLTAFLSMMHFHQVYALIFSPAGLWDCSGPRHGPDLKNWVLEILTPWLKASVSSKCREFLVLLCRSCYQAVGRGRVQHFYTLIHLLLKRLLRLITNLKFWIQQ